MFKLTNISVILLITTLINLFTAYISWQRKKTKGGVYIALGMMGIALWTLASSLDYAAIPIPLKVFFAKLEYTGYNSALSMLAIFSLFFAGHENLWEKNWVRVFFALPFVSALLAWTNDLHGWLWSGFTRSALGDNTVIYEHGPGFAWTVIIGYLMIAVIVANLWRAAREGSELSKRQARLLLLATFIPILSNLVYLFRNQFSNGVDWTSLTFSISGLFFVWALYGTRFLDIVPIARDTIFEHMGDGVLVLDNNNNVVDFNPAAQKFFRLKHDQQGSPIQAVMASWPEVTKFALSNPDTTISQVNIIDTEDARVYNAQINLLKNGREQIYGKLIRFRDITEQYRAQKELLESESLMRAIAENYPNSYLIIIKEDFSVSFASGNEYKKQNLEPGQLIGARLEAFFEDQTMVIEEHCKKTFTGKEQKFELFIKRCIMSPKMRV